MSFPLHEVQKWAWWSYGNWNDFLEYVSRCQRVSRGNIHMGKDSPESHSIALRYSHAPPNIGTSRFFLRIDSILALNLLAFSMRP